MQNNSIGKPARVERYEPYVVENLVAAKTAIESLNDHLQQAVGVSPDNVHFVDLTFSFAALARNPRAVQHSINMIKTNMPTNTTGTATWSNIDGIAHDGDGNEIGGFVHINLSVDPSQL